MAEVLRDSPSLLGVEWGADNRLETIFEPRTTARLGAKFFDLYTSAGDEDGCDERWLLRQWGSECSGAQGLSRSIMRGLPVAGVRAALNLRVKDSGFTHAELHLHERRFEKKQELTARRQEVRLEMRQLYHESLQAEAALESAEAAAQLLVRDEELEEANGLGQLVSVEAGRESRGPEKAAKKRRIDAAGQKRRRCQQLKRQYAQKSREFDELTSRDHLTKVVFLHTLTVLAPSGGLLGDACLRFPVGLDILVSLWRALKIKAAAQEAGARGHATIPEQVLEALCAPVVSALDNQFSEPGVPYSDQLRCMLGSQCGWHFTPAPPDEDAPGGQLGDPAPKRQKRMRSAASACYCFFTTADNMSCIMKSSPAGSRTPLMLAREPKVGGSRVAMRSFLMVADRVLALHPDCRMVVACGNCLKKRRGPFGHIYQLHVAALERHSASQMLREARSASLAPLHDEMPGPSSL